MSRSISDDFDLLCKFGGKRLYAIVCQLVADGRMSIMDASWFLNEPPASIVECAEEIESVRYAVKNAMENGMTVDEVMRAENKRRA